MSIIPKSCTCVNPITQESRASEQKKCINCEGQHAADSRECPRMKEEVAIQRVRDARKISYLEAKRKDLHAMIYAGAFAVLKLNGQRPTDVTSRNGTKRQPAWERRLSKNIDNIRSDIAILTQYQKPTYSQRVKKKGDTIMRRSSKKTQP
ncbi:unnamed protein product [Acanthoscelides obtectus]|uniref:Uncharacterized protein n=1 Tax=Acanthoscelides obtectus TaxID=200917 RepID=A0A9P0VR45_ACAOB|nr:unnamed protein product [Acanthoscelides obtectus]CAK1687382.1 hypothetical protein AOBTE_LOCUS36249 [Acanthoscelides obtectus]